MSTTKLLAEYPQPKQAAKKEGLSKEEFKEQQMQQRLADTQPKKPRNKTPIPRATASP